jgi:tetratricopeptide (TPR) repeat protein
VDKELPNKQPSAERVYTAPVLPKEVREYYENGILAYNKKNYDYAIRLFRSALSLQQDLPETRRYLHLTFKRKFEEHPLPPLARYFLRAGSYFAIVRAAMASKRGGYLKAIEILENALQRDPKNAAILLRLGQFLLLEGFLDSAIKTFEEALEIKPHNIRLLEALGGFYAKKKQYRLARGCYARILSISPLNSEAMDAVKNIDALHSIESGGWDDLTSYRTKIRDEKLAAQPDLPPIISQEEAKLKRNPNDIDALLSLVSLYSESGQLKEAIEKCNRILQLEPAHSLAREKYFALQFQEINKEIEQAESALKTSPDDPLIISQLHQLQSKKLKIRLPGIRDRIQRYPNDPVLRYEYGVLLWETGELDKAIAQFQLSAKDPHLRTRALNMLGLCFKKKNMLDLAVTQFRKALQNITALNEEAKQIIYNLATTYEVIGEQQKALEEYKKIYEVDINYKDVAEKVQKAYPGSA